MCTGRDLSMVSLSSAIGNCIAAHFGCAVDVAFLVAVDMALFPILVTMDMALFPILDMALVSNPVRPLQFNFLFLIQFIIKTNAAGSSQNKHSKKQQHRGVAAHGN